MSERDESDRKKGSMSDIRGGRGMLHRMFAKRSDKVSKGNREDIDK